eukprot:scaffold617411_cov59-Attheya_sp.AAC.1
MDSSTGLYQSSSALFENGVGNNNNNENAGKQKCYTAKTKVCRRTLNPNWEEEFRFEVADDSLLQDEPLIFKVCDVDATTAGESIGLVYVDLNPLLAQTARRQDRVTKDNAGGSSQKGARSTAAGTKDGL